ncbi:hypothetical protein CIG75_12795 [Tumebacillus algifaecis]|uniref:Uncharacterized protein n=1 Tax=Tumebacillus algifaecis TaxID=1214604 RepID=A0A223D308_9BACL|nr:hypothetical protein [Tumebacillus algifaecis]ASS75777.1 hypothetical protein CIG75_12795 [Tumebacillus algifaecis]
MPIETQTLIPFLDSQSQGSSDVVVEPYLDATNGPVEIVDQSNGQIGFKAGPKLYKMLGTRADVVNGNNRVYPRAVLSSMVGEWKANNPRGAIGEEGHPDSYKRADGKLGWKSKTENKCIKVVDVLEPDQAGNVYFIFHTIDTQRGRDLQAVLDAGGKIGCSMRASGSGKRGQFNGKAVTVATRLELTVFDVLDDPALTDTLGSAVPITDGQIDEILSDDRGDQQEYSDAVDPFIKQVKAAEKLSDLTRLKNKVEQEELDAIDRAAFDTAWYKRWWQIRELIEAEEMDKRANRIGFTDHQEHPNGEEGDENLKYTFQQLMAMTDSELKRIRTEEADCAPMCDAILGQREAEEQKNELETLRQAEEQRKNRVAAQAFIDSQEVQDKLAKLPPHVQKVVTDKIDLTSKDLAEKTFNDAFDFAAQLSADNKLKNLGFDRNNPIVDAQARVNSGVEHVGEENGWMEVADKLREAVEDVQSMVDSVDENTKKLNKHVVKEVLDAFDAANGDRLSLFADSFDTATTTTSVMNGVIFERQIIEQVFQTMIALHFVETGTFKGQFAKIPRETYARSNSRPTRNGEMKPMAKGKLSLDFLQIVARTRKLAAEISLETMTFLKSGPLNYNALARLVYHIAEDLKRETSLDLHEEMLLSADEHGAIRVNGETPKISPDRATITLLRGGTLAEPNHYVPIVRERFSNVLTESGVQNQVLNKIVVKVDGVEVELSTAEIDYDNGTITLDGALSNGAVTVDYSYVTNIQLFNLSPAAGMDYEKHLNKLLHLIGAQKAAMGSAPNFYRPNFGMMSEVLSNEISQAELFKTWSKMNGSDLNPTGWVAQIKGINMVEHNEPWSAGDSRLLLGQRGATKYAIETGMTMKGPFETRTDEGELNGGEEIYLFCNDAIKTPIQQKLRTIKFYRSEQ